jgi:TrmH family RNA methyltransferase
MISKNLLKYIHSLQLKKFRKTHNAFLVEGAKSVTELLESDFQVQTVLTTADFVQKNNFLFKNPSFECYIITEDELAKAGTFQTNDAALAVAAIKPNDPVYVQGNEYVLMLDDVRDPGNLGTIIRIADWYGIKKIICSEQTADWYNPKTIAASMGSFTRVKGYYCKLDEYLKQAESIPVYGAFLDGENIHHVRFPEKGIVVMGNESNGISAELGRKISHKVSIPAFGKAESLNVAIATAVICDNIRRFA